MDSIEKIHHVKEDNSVYFNIQNQEIIKLMSEQPGSVLDVGCAKGALGRQVIEEKKPAVYEGIELLPDVAKEAEKYLSKVYVGQAEYWLPKLPESKYDWVIFADSLEHTIDPWNVLKEARRVLKPKGKLLISIPNVRNLGVITDLLVKGKWQYRDFGIMDQGHLRFFTKKSLINMVETEGFKVNKIYSNPLNRWKKLPGRFISRMISLAIGKPGAYEEFITVQWIMGAEKVS